MLGKFPRVVYIDNGKAFRAEFFEKTPDFNQAGISGLYTALGCEVVHAWSYHGQSKPIERFSGLERVSLQKILRRYGIDAAGFRR